MSKKVIVHTGQSTTTSGQYRPAGAKTEITLSRSDRVPPYRGTAKNFVLVDKTKHKA